jgi:hypothetical protein
MHECIGLAVVALNEAEALHCVEELDRTAGLLTGQLALRTTAAPSSRAVAAATALDSHRLALDSEVRCRDPAAAIDERELERLAVSEIRETRLLDRRDVDEDVFAAIVTNDEAEALLRVEEFDDAFAFANDLRRHSSAAAAPTAKTAATAAAAAESTAAATAEAITTTAAEATAVAITAASSAAAEAAALLEAATKITCETLFAAETFALVAAAPAAVAFAPSIETHEPSVLKVSPPTPETNALGPNGATGHGT